MAVLRGMGKTFWSRFQGNSPKPVCPAQEHLAAVTPFHLREEYWFPFPPHAFSGVCSDQSRFRIGPVFWESALKRIAATLSKRTDLLPE
jgi:hypothetical protein